MNIRQKHILRTLINEKSINIISCAQKYNVGERTIRYDMDIIADYILSRVEHQGITIKKNVVYFLLNSQQVKELALDKMDNDYYEIKIPSEERIIMILCDLCWAHDKMTIQQLADKYFVSRGTINSDLVEVKEWCKKRNIPFIAKKGKGIYVDATEKQRRGYITDLIRSSAKLNNNKDFIFNEWFKDIDVEIIKTIVMHAEKKYGIWLADVAFEGLSIHIALSIKRNQSHGVGDEHDQSQQYRDIEPTLYKMATEIVREVNKKFQLNLPKTEITYVAIHLGGKTNYLKTVGENVLVEYYAINMIIHVSNMINVDLKKDKKLFDGLMQHLKACHYRYQNEMVMENPLKDDLIEKYPHLYQIIALFIKNSENQGFIKFNDDEITYVLLHFAAAINRKSNKLKAVPNILVVCSTGVGTSELVISSLNKHFKFNIQASAALHQLNYYISKYPIDLIITTVPLEAVIPHVRVNPILTSNDIRHTQELLSLLGFEVINQENTVVNELTAMMDHYARHQDASKLITELTEIYNKCKPNKQEEYKMLSDLLTKETINLQSDCSNWQEAIQTSGKILERDKYITEEYIQASIDSVKEHGPYIVVTKGVALAHAVNNHGVLKTGMSLARLNTPVEFGNKSNDPVKFVFMLAAIDSTSHLVALSDLAEFLEREEFMRILNQATKAEQLIEYIKENETNTKGGKENDADKEGGEKEND